MENKIYNPAGQPKEWLIEHFVVRTNVFEKIFKDLQTGKMQYPEQHYLIQGQRGMGKTTLLLRLKYEIENTPKLNTWLVSVFFNEESYDLTSLSNLWEKLLKYLDNLWNTGGEYYKKTDEFLHKPDYEKNCFELLIGILKDNKKKLVVFFDNFGQLFLDHLKEKEQHRFREILMNCNDIRIIGASAVVLHDLHDYSKPFFEFFKIITLEGLNKDETVSLIAKLQEKSEHKINIEKHKNKIETLAILTGGVIRTVMLIYEVILADEDGTALRDLEAILDRITPLYKHRIEDLPVQQRKIIDVIAKRWDAISTKDIAENIREDGKPMATKLISAQLQQLEKNNVIEKKQTNTKNHLYQLKERFFNIWYLMRNGDRTDKCRVIWLTKFLETWYDDEAGIESFIKNHIELLKSGKYYPTSAIMIAEALTHSSKVNFDNQAMLIKETAVILNEEQKKLLPTISLDKYNRAVAFFRENKYTEAIVLFESMDQTSETANSMLVLSYLYVNDPQKAISSINADNKVKSFLLGLAYSQLKEFNKSVKYLEEALNNEELESQKGRIASTIGEIYQSEKKDINKAIKYYKIALDNGNDNAYQNIIDACINNQNYKEAEEYCLKAIDSGKIGFEKELIELYIYNLKEFNKADDLINSGQRNHPKDGEYSFYKAIIWFFKGENTGSEKSLLKAKKLLLNENKADSNNYKLLIMLLSYMYIEAKNKNKALEIAAELDLKTGVLGYLIKSIIYIWNNKLKDAFNFIDEYFEQALSFKLDIQSDIHNEYTELLILLLIAKKQYHFTLKLFEKESLNLKDKFKPIYYALMHYLKDEYPNEYLKMGEELKQPVQDIMTKIEEMAVEYA